MRRGTTPLHTFTLPLDLNNVTDLRIIYVTQSGECGLYDRVTEQFYGNDGDGEFEVET